MYASTMTKMIASAVFTVGFAVTAAASLLVYDGFDYSGDTIIGGNGGIGWNGTWFNDSGTGNPPVLAGAQPSSLTHSSFPFPTVGGHASMNHTVASPKRLLSSEVMENTNVGEGNVVYFSYLIEAESRTRNFVVFHGLSQGLETNLTPVSTGLAPFGTASMITVAWVGSTTGGLGGNTGQTLNTYLMIGRIDSTGVRISSFLEGDTIPETEPDTWEFTNTGGGTPLGGTINRVEFRYHTGSFDGTWNNNGLPMRVDEFRMGTTWHAVAVPEPGTVMLLGLGGLVLFQTYKRRKNSVKF